MTSVGVLLSSFRLAEAPVVQIADSSKEQPTGHPDKIKVMNNSVTKKSMIPLCYRTGMTIQQTSHLMVDKDLVTSHWNEPENKCRLSSLGLQRTMPILVKPLHAAGKKAKENSRFCGLSQRTIWAFLAREI